MVASDRRPTPPPVKHEEYKVYLLDDDDSVRKALSRLLRAEGLNSQSFSSGEAFLAGLPETAHGCVVMDIRMPGLTGHDVQQRLRQRGQHIPVIALSAQADEQSRQRARELGAVAFFRKPVDDQALLDSIYWQLGNPAPATT